MSTRTKLAVILHADVVGSTALVQADEQVTHDRIRSAFRQLSETIARHAGMAHEIRGDALVAVFDRPSDAIAAALVFQEQHRKELVTLSDLIRVHIRIGIAMGEVVVADNTVTGAGVVLAQRLEQLAKPDGVVISAAVRESAPGRLGLTYEDLGEASLKGFESPQRAFRVEANDRSTISHDDFADTASDSLDLPEMGRASIAVLPFKNLSNDDEQEFFADGIAEDIITGLSKFRWLFVIARNSSFTFKGRAFDLKDVARKLDVRYILEGSVRTAGKRIRVTGQLIEAQTENHVWAERYDRELEDIFSIQDDLTEAIVAAIAPEIDQAERKRARRTPPDRVDIWLLFQRGLDAYYATTESALDDAISIFDRVAQMDPGYALALAMAAVSRVRLAVNFRPDEHAGLMNAARHQSEAAIQLDPRDPVVLWADGRVQSILGNHERAISQTERAITLNPNYALAYFGLGNALSRCNRASQALECVNRAIKLSPCDPFLAAFHVVQGWSLFLLERYPECIEASRRAISLGNATIWAYVILSLGLEKVGESESAQAALGEVAVREPKFSIAFWNKAQRNVHQDSAAKVSEVLRALGVSEE